MQDVDAQICYNMPDAIQEVVRQDPVRFGGRGPGIDCATKVPMIDVFFHMTQRLGINPSPTAYLNAFSDVQGLIRQRNVDGLVETVEIQSAWRKRIMNAYAGFVNGMVVAGFCFMSGKVRRCVWSKLSDHYSKIDLIVTRADGTQVTVGLTMDSVEAAFFAQRKRHSGNGWPDVVILLNASERYDRATGMAWYVAKDIEPILSWGSHEN